MNVNVKNLSRELIELLRQLSDVAIEDKDNPFGIESITEIDKGSYSVSLKDGESFEGFIGTLKDFDPNVRYETTVEDEK